MLILKQFASDLKPVTFASISNLLQCNSHSWMGSVPYSYSNVFFHLGPKKIVT